MTDTPEDRPSLESRLYPSMEPEAAKAPAEPAKRDGNRKSLAERLYSGPPKHEDVFAKMGEEARAKREAEAGKAKPDTATGTGADAEGKDDVTEEGAFDFAAEAEDMGYIAGHPDTDAFGAVVKDLGLDKPKVERLIQFDRERTERSLEHTSKTWLNTAKASPTFDADVAVGRQVLRDHADPEVMYLIENWRLGNNPGVIKLLGKLGRAAGYR